MKILITFLSSTLIALNIYASQNLEIKVNSNPDQLNSYERQVDRYSYNFGRVWLNRTQVASYKLTNTGTTPLTFQQATIGGTGYSATHSCTGVLAPNAVCNFTIRFHPVFEGLQTGRFVLSFVEDLDIVVDLWGEGYRQ